MVNICNQTASVTIEVGDFERLRGFQSALINFLTKYSDNAGSFKDYSIDKDYLGELLQAFMLDKTNSVELVLDDEEYQKVFDENEALNKKVKELEKVLGNREKNKAKSSADY